MYEISKSELKEYTINRLITNDYESSGLFYQYIEETDEDNISFSDWLKDNYNEIDVEEVENTIIDNLRKNYHYLD